MTGSMFYNSADFDFSYEIIELSRLSNENVLLTQVADYTTCAAKSFALEISTINPVMTTTGTMIRTTNTVIIPKEVEVTAEQVVTFPIDFSMIACIVMYLLFLSVIEKISI